MSKSSTSFEKLRARPRKAVRLSEDELVKRGPLRPDQPLPQVVEAAGNDINLIRWAAAHRTQIVEELGRYGGLLFRNFRPLSVDEFETFVTTAAGEPLRYTERSSPRSQVSGRIYTSTDYPPEQPIFLHNEQSYNLTFPTRILFYCVTNSREGGETPIADSRRIYQRLDPEIRQRFVDQDYLYVRNFGDGCGLSWQDAFQTADPAAVEEYCRHHQIELAWKEEGKRLRTAQRRRVVAKHPQTGDLSWFNHLTFFHVSSLAPGVREAMLHEFDEQDLPNNTYYGDGSPIEPEVMDHLRDLYTEETVVFPWQEGDVLMLDNLLVAHGRRPFAGQRRVVVGMADPCDWQDV